MGWQEVTSRSLAALIAGYALTYAVAGFIAMLPASRTNGAYLSIQFALIPMTCALLWAFAAKTPLRAWRDILVATLAFVLGIVVLRVA